MSTEIIPAGEPSAAPAASLPVARLANPLDLPAVDFQHALSRRAENRRALTDLIGRLATQAEIYGRPRPRIEELRTLGPLTEAELMTALDSEPGLIEETLEAHLTTLAREIGQILRYGADVAAKRIEIGAAVRRLLWRAASEVILDALLEELERREGRTAESSPSLEAAREAGAPLAGEIP